MSKTFTKGLLSGSTDGRGIKVVQTATAGTLLHTATGAANLDAITLYAYNGHTANVDLTLEWGGVTVPDDNVKLTIPFKAGLILVTDRLLLRNSLVIRAFASVANVIVMSGWVDNIA